MVRCMYQITLYVILQYIYIISSTLFECHAIVEDNFENCTKKAYNTIRYNQSLKEMCNDSLQCDITKNTCINNNICCKVFHLAYFSQFLFSITIKHTILNMLHNCCGNDTKCFVVRELTEISQINKSTTHPIDIIFPMIAPLGLDKLYGFYFISLFQVPSSYYFTLRVTNKETMTKLIATCTNIWPLLLICLLMSLISGFLIWIIEIHVNSEEFQRPFHIGLLDGFWWSFVTMTTLGYGDKVPKSHPGRILAVLWIFIGMTMCSIYTASVTTEILSYRSPPYMEMTGKRVGTLKHRLQDASIISQHGGIVQTTDDYKTVRGVTELITRLQNKDIDGFLINKNTYYHYSGRLKEEKYKQYADTIQTLYRREVFHQEGEALWCGMLVKHKTDYMYFKRYFDNNRMQLQTCNFLRMNEKETDNQHHLFSPHGELFEYFLYYSLGIIAVIVCFGIYYEKRRRYIARNITEGGGSPSSEDLDGTGSHGIHQKVYELIDKCEVTFDN